MGGQLDGVNDPFNCQDKNCQFCRRESWARIGGIICIVGDWEQGRGNHSPQAFPVKGKFYLRFSGLEHLFHYQNDRTAPTDPERWASVRKTLIRSIRTGVFFDRKYWARHAKTGDALKPIYFPNAVMEDKATYLGRCASKFVCLRTTALTILSGEVPKGSTSTHRQPRGILFPYR